MGDLPSYYCDRYRCHFQHSGWCSYWDSTMDLMKHRGQVCPMSGEMYIAIDMLMDPDYELGDDVV